MAKDCLDIFEANKKHIYGSIATTKFTFSDDTEFSRPSEKNNFYNVDNDNDIDNIDYFSYKDTSKGV